jgi:hypothetical protein
VLPLVFAATSPAAAAVPTETSVQTSRAPGAAGPDELAAPHRLRTGLVLGLSLGAGVLGASGYPNDATEIGDPNFYSASGWMLCTSESLFLLGALTDYLSVGFWYAHAAASNKDWRSNGNGGGLRVEAFPLALVLPQFGGLGLLGEFGIGVGNLMSKTPGLPNSEGTQSFAAAGVFWEWSLVHLLGGHLSLGPSLEYDAIFSQSFERHGLLASARVAFYGGP